MTTGTVVTETLPVGVVGLVAVYASGRSFPVFLTRFMAA